MNNHRRRLKPFEEFFLKFLLQWFSKIFEQKCWEKETGDSAVLKLLFVPTRKKLINLLSNKRIKIKNIQHLFSRHEGPARNGPVKRTPGRLPRIPFSPHQLNELELAYKHANYLSSEDANRLAARLNLTCVRVKIWFQNRRARERREKKELNASNSS